MPIPIEIDVWQGEIAELEVDAILVPANESLFMTTPVGRAVRQRAGESVERDAVQQGPVKAGSAVVTGGGDLAAPYVVHVVAVGHDLRADPERLSRALDAALLSVLQSRASAQEPLPSSLVVAVPGPAEATAYRLALATLEAPR